MKSLNSFKKDNKAVFGLTSVQQFFAIILGVALLAYVIVAIMGTLDQANLITAGTLSALVINESGFLNSSGDFASNISVPGFSNFAIVAMINASSGTVLTANNYSVNAATGFYNRSAANPQTYANVNFTYTYNYDSSIVNNADSILANTSQGVSSFFSAINPVYAILAILVIILVLVVLVKVVTGGGVGANRRSEPQL